jgi:HlyD family secretion protein
VISANNPDLALLPGMTANVRIVVENRVGVLKVPNAALRWRPAGGRGQAAAGRVYVVEAGQLKPVDVRLGVTDGSSTEIVGGGLAEGTEVVIGLREPVESLRLR